MGPTLDVITSFSLVLLGALNEIGVENKGSK